MRVLLIDVNCKLSSTGKIVYNLYNFLNSNGDKAAVCYGRGEKIKEENIYKFGLDWETNLHAALARITGFNGYFSPLSTSRLIRFIDEFKPDVIHIHELHAYFVNIKPLIEYIKKKKIKTIWTFHCEYMYTGKCGHAFDCDNYISGCGNCPAVHDYPKSLIFDRTKVMFKMKEQLLKDWDFTIVTPSKWLADRIKSSFLKEKKIEIIHNGIDVENIFYPRKEEEYKEILDKYQLNGKKIILSVAPNIMSDLKGGKTVISVSRLCRNSNIQFVLIGADKTEKPSDNVLILQAIRDQNELAKWYSLADVFLICSKRENFPTTCLEAFCCGTPVVGIDSGGTKETVPDPYGKFVKTTNNLKDTGIAEKLLELINAKIGPNNCARYKEKCSEVGAKMYSNQAMCKTYYKLYLQ